MTTGPSLPPAPSVHPPPPDAPDARPSVNRELVRKPPKGRECKYSAFIRPDDHFKFIQAKPHIRKLVGVILNINVCWGSQGARVIERLKEEILRDFPIFTEYEDAWPAMYYAYQQLGDYRRTVDPSLKRRRRQPVRFPAQGSSGGRQNRATSASSCASGDANGIETGLGDRNVAGAADKTNDDQREAACPRAHPGVRATTTCASPSPVGIGGLTPLVQSTTAAAGQADDHQNHRARRLVTMVDLTGQDNRDVFEFLCGIDTTFAYLIDRFRMAGLTSRMRLTTLARWRAADVDEFLASEVRLTPFERKAVKVALGKLVG